MHAVPRTMNNAANEAAVLTQMRMISDRRNQRSMPDAVALLKQWHDNTANQRPKLEGLRVNEQGMVAGRFHRCEITSAFQPVFYADEARVAGYQAQARISGGQGNGLSPWGLFSLAADDEELISLDRRCRLVHTLNFFAAGLQGAWLQLCVHDRLVAAVARDHGREFGRILDLLGLQRERVVIVLPSLPPDSDEICIEALRNYQSQGFGTAVTPDSAQQVSNLLQRIQPDVIRLDARLMHMDTDWSRVLKQARLQGVRVHVKRVETEEDRRLALSLGATALQGLLLAGSMECMPSWGVPQPRQMEMA